VYGYNPAYRIDAVVNRFLFQANFTGRITINGSGDQHRSFIHVDKLATATTSAVDGKVAPGVYNVVEHNLTINDIASRIKELYPGLDIIHANYNIRMKDIITALPCRIWQQVQPEPTAFAEELLAFKSHFSF
jgi:UDP-glucose 4-epimerase